VPQLHEEKKARGSRGFFTGLAGNLANRNGQAYGFDYGNRLRGVTGKEWYAYDALGRRVQTHQDSGQDRLYMYGRSGKLLFDWKGPRYLAAWTNLHRLCGACVDDDL
jgi:hypothetical protein